MNEVSTLFNRVPRVIGSLSAPLLDISWTRWRDRGHDGGMMDRRRFLMNTTLTLTGLVAARAFTATPVSAAAIPDTTSAEPVRDLGAASRPSVARLRVREPGSYRIDGVVRLD